MGISTPTLDHAAEPKYWHLRTVLLRAIESEFAEGAVLPNERDLSARFGVARATLRQALDQLELEGRLSRRRGVGTVVAGPRVDVTVGDDGEDWPAADPRDSRLVDCVTAPADPRVARGLGVGPRALVHHVRRRRTSLRQSVGLENLYVPRAVVPRVPDLLGDASRAPLVLRHLRHRPLDHRRRAVELGVAEADEARLLDRPPGTAVLVVTTTYVSGGRTAALAVATYRADTVRLAFADGGPDRRTA